MNDALFCAAYATSGPAGPRTRARWKAALPRGGRRLALSDALVVAADGAGQVVAVERESGAERWRLEGLAGNPQGVALDEGCVYLAEEGGFRAFRLADGMPLWQLDEPRGAGWAPLPCPGGVVVGTSPTATIYRVDTATRSVLWSRTVGEAGHVMLALAGDALVYTVWCHHLQRQTQVGCLDLATGAERWARGLTERTHCSAPTVVAGRVCLGVGRRVLAFDLEQGQPLWQYGPQGAPVADPVSDGHWLYIAGLEGRVAALSLEDGAVRWAVDVPVKGRREIYALALSLADGQLYAGCGRKKLLALRSEDGAVVWSAGVPGHIGVPPIVEDGVLYYSTGYPKSLLIARR